VCVGKRLEKEGLKGWTLSDTLWINLIPALVCLLGHEGLISRLVCAGYSIDHICARNGIWEMAFCRKLHRRFMSSSCFLLGDNVSSGGCSSSACVRGSKGLLAPAACCGWLSARLHDSGANAPSRF
jgi:hypothetical protein